MATVVFDFDSTLIRAESLEEILKPRLQAQPVLARELANLTEAGMEGGISFAESLRKRLALAAPRRDEIHAFGKRAVTLITPGMEALVEELLARGNQVRIVSGGPIEAILPLARALKIPVAHVHAVRLVWDSNGSFRGIDERDRFGIGKSEGFAPFADSLPAPSIAVGDGMTDLQLFRDGLVDRFIAFTGNVRRAFVEEAAVPEAGDVDALRNLIFDFLNDPGGEPSSFNPITHRGSP